MPASPFGETPRPPLACTVGIPLRRQCMASFSPVAPVSRLVSEFPRFESIHIYPFLAEVLDLEPNPVMDGKLSVLGSLLGARD